MAVLRKTKLLFKHNYKHGHTSHQLSRAATSVKTVKRIIKFADKLTWSNHSQTKHTTVEQRQRGGSTQPDSKGSIMQNTSVNHLVSELRR